VPTVEQLSGDSPPHLARLRAESPVAWVPELGAWLVTGRDAAVEVMRDERRFTVDDPRFSTARVVGPSMLSLDGADHTRHRSAFGAAFRPALTRERMTEKVSAIATRLVASMVDAGPLDLRTALAAPLAAESAIHVLGLAETTPADVLGWYTSIVAEVSAVTVNPDRTADDSLMDGVRASVARSVAVAGAPLALIREDADLTDAEFASNVAIVLFGALETSEAMITNLLWWVIGDSELLGHLRATPERRGRAVDESLRLEPGAALVDRFAVASTEIAGVAVDAGDPVTVSLTAANRDPCAYRDPDRFSLGRDGEPPHLAFATGPHVCLGANLARMEARAALDAVCGGIESIPGADGFDAPTGLVFRKPARLMVEFRAPRNRSRHSR
jgi:cytochrome P450